MPRAIVLEDPADVRQACDDARARGLRVGFVPTMGALHDGHLSLVREARAIAGDRAFVVTSIFVNPTQFGPNEDFAKYPRDLAGDTAKLEPAGCDLVFAPSAGAMYPAGESTRVRVDGVSEHLCGPHRPGHFEGVATVVAKLFSVVGPSVAVFGKKDYQQLAVLKRMARDLFMPVDVRGLPIVREADGLAMSSRNAYLSAEERQRALGLSRGLAAAHDAFENGERSAGKLRALAHREVEKVATSIDYVTIADADAITPFADDVSVPDRAVLAIACRVGGTRLIDNVVLGEDPSPVRA